MGSDGVQAPFERYNKTKGSQTKKTWRSIRWFQKTKTNRIILFFNVYMCVHRYEHVCVCVCMYVCVKERAWAREMYQYRLTSLFQNATLVQKKQKKIIHSLFQKKKRERERTQRNTKITTSITSWSMGIFRLLACLTQTRAKDVWNKRRAHHSRHWRWRPFNSKQKKEKYFKLPKWEYIRFYPL